MIPSVEDSVQRLLCVLFNFAVSCCLFLAVSLSLSPPLSSVLVQDDENDKASLSIQDKQRAPDADQVSKLSSYEAEQGVRDCNC